MEIIQESVQSIDALKKRILSRKPLVFKGAQTSTVLPFEFLDQYNNDSIKELHVINLQSIPPQMELIDNILHIQGSVSWEMARDFCHRKAREISCWPTEQSAFVLSSVATSATGERSFAFGSLREQIESLAFLDYQAQEHILEKRPLVQSEYFKDHLKLLKNYQNSLGPYNHFKNAIAPLLNNELDLMVGTEGQLGVVTSVALKTVALEPTRVIFFKLPRWEESFQAHMEVISIADQLREVVLACELLDSHSLKFVSQLQRPFVDADLIYCEVRSQYFDKFLQKILSHVKHINEADIFEAPSSEFLKMRTEVPRAISDYLGRHKLKKKGTDVQIVREQFEQLVELYRTYAREGIQYYLFGHIGDCHLHFNFLPKVSEASKCDKILSDFYQKISSWNVSPFAEHGIGLLKQNFMGNFYKNEHCAMFQFLKKTFDPYKQFFPMGFMSLKQGPSD